MSYHYLGLSPEGRTLRNLRVRKELLDRASESWTNPDKAGYYRSRFAKSWQARQSWLHDAQQRVNAMYTRHTAALRRGLDSTLRCKDDWMTMPTTQIKSLLGLDRASNVEDVLLPLLKAKYMAGAQARALSYRFLIQQEAIDRRDHYWFFLTLTVDDDHMDDVFAQGSRAWEFFRLKLYRLFPDDADVSHFGVVEYGTETGRPHIHVLLSTDTLPSHWRDPNQGKLHPTHDKLIGVLDNVWSYGYYTLMPVRLSHGDAFGRVGWAWPSYPQTDRRGRPHPHGGQPRKTSTIDVLSNYITKYITKSYNDRKEGDPAWRIRKPRGYGSRGMVQLMRNLPTSALLTLITQTDEVLYHRPGTRPILTMRTMTLPTALTRYIASTEL